MRGIMDLHYTLKNRRQQPNFQGTSRPAWDGVAVLVFAPRGRRGVHRPQLATYGNTYGPFGITATLAAGPYSASDSATACSTDAAGSA